MKLRIYEINTRAHCQKLDDISDAELSKLSRLGFDAIWLMGVWETSAGARTLSKLVSEDFEGSPYAIPEYKFNHALGGKRSFKSLTRRAHEAGLRVLVDFVPNHMALDSPWIAENPALFIRGDTSARKQSTSDYFLHPSGEMIAFGRDPYFPPWHDTAQLDYSNKATRSRMIATLKWISQYADGVRCDMAMLVMRDYIRRQWYPLASASYFDERMPSEFWDQAISEVKAIRPDFIFIAEAYWEKEPELLRLGFDFAYEKKLYDGLVERDAQLITERLTRDRRALEGSLYFIENHDEPRAASVFDRDSKLAAAAMILSLPGAALIHEGQMEGKRERLPVQRIIPLEKEPPDLALKHAYAQLLDITSDPVFSEGAFRLFDSGLYGVVSFLRQSPKRIVAYLSQIADAWHSFDSAQLDITAMAEAIGAQQGLRVVSLLTSHSILIEKRHGRFLFRPNQLSDATTRYCLIEVWKAD